jgi:predicted ribosome quality control (RQC) complex YloA/Tae2 family protein
MVQYLDDCKEVFTVLSDVGITVFRKEFETSSFEKKDYIKYLAEIVNNVLEKSMNYILTLEQIKLAQKQAELAQKQADLVQEQINEAKKLLPMKEALAAAQVKKEITGAMLQLKQMTAYDDNIFVKYVETEGNTIGMVDAGSGRIDADKWTHFSASLDTLKARSKTDDERIKQLVKVVKDMQV